MRSWALIMYIVMVLILLVLAGIDIKTKKVSIVGLLLLLFASIGYIIANEDRALLFSAIGVGIGMLFLFISKVTGEGFGYGDSSVVLILGLSLGGHELIRILIIAFLILWVVSMFLFVVKRKRKQSLPFLPFVLIGSVMAVII